MISFSLYYCNIFSNFLSYLKNINNFKVNINFFVEDFFLYYYLFVLYFYGRFYIFRDYINRLYFCYLFKFIFLYYMEIV